MLKEKSKMTPRNVIFEMVMRVVLSRVTTLEKLDLESKARLPININYLLLEFTFKWF